MKRMLRAAAAAAILTGGLGSVGCVGTGGHGGGDGHGVIGDKWRNAVDPCYPERYNHAARQAVIAPFAQQVHNGHVLNQTLWNYHFETGKDALNASGREKLISIARTRPAADPKLYLQASMDLAVTETNADTIADLRSELDVKRAASIQKYLATIPAVAPVAYEVYVHNPATPGLIAEAAAGSYRASLQGYSGSINGGAGQGSLSTGGSTNLTVAPVINNTGGGGAAPR